MNRAELLALAERCEAATGADRVLDGDIATALGWAEVHGSVLQPAFRGGRPPGVTDWWAHVPAFTASLDAALTLVPEGLDWRVEVERSRRPGAICCQHEAWGRFPCVTMRGAATPALALCAAALRARAAKEGA